MSKKPNRPVRKDNHQLHIDGFIGMCEFLGLPVIPDWQKRMIRANEEWLKKRENK